MSILAQGTQFFVIDPNLDSNGPGVLEIDCITAFNPGGNPSDQIEDTCLKYNSRTYKKGLRTPGQATGTLNADPENDSHYRFWQFAEDPEFDQIEMDMVIGWADGPLDQSGEPISIPTVASDGGFNLPANRTWYRFRGYVSDFPFDFQSNAVVATNFTIQRSGRGYWIRKAV